MNARRTALLVLVTLSLMVVAIVHLAQAQTETPPVFAPPSLGVPAQVASGPRAGQSGIDYSGCGGVTAPGVNPAHEQQVVELVNAARASNGLPPLKAVTNLVQAGRYHVTDLGQDNYFDHDSYDRSGGSLTYVCAWSVRISSYYAGWQALAENVAAGYQTPQAVMDAWMNSPGHRGNILSSQAWELGVGYYEGSGSYGRYWVQDFGRRSGIYPLVINQEAKTTFSPHVTLYIYGSWAEVRLRNESGAWSQWIPFQNTLDWQVEAQNGLRTVWAEMRTGGQTVSSSDSIDLLPTTLADIVAVAQHWHCVAGAACYIAQHDHDNDGDIDIVDVMLIAARWNGT